MYIEKRKAKGKLKYYLSHSFREGGKVHKIRKYLGENLNVQLLKERHSSSVRYNESGNKALRIQEVKIV